jgi:hypothetical protein
MLFARRLTSSDVRGSETTIVDAKLHFEHPKIRVSERPGRGSTRVKLIRAPHRGQRGRSIGVNRKALRDAIMSLALISGSTRFPLAGSNWENREQKVNPEPPSVCPRTDITTVNVFGQPADSWIRQFCCSAVVLANHFWGRAASPLAGALCKISARSLAGLCANGAP